MVYFPSHVLNYINLFIQSPTNKLMKYVIDHYEKDYRECYDDLNDDYCDYCLQLDYSFVEWYFIYRKHYVYKRVINARYKHIPAIIPIKYEH